MIPHNGIELNSVVLCKNRLSPGFYVEQFLILKFVCPLLPVMIVIPLSFQCFFWFQSGFPKSCVDIRDEIRIELFNVRNWLQFKIRKFFLFYYHDCILETFRF